MSINCDNLRGNIRRGSAPSSPLPVQVISNSKIENDKNKNDWDRFTEWCNENNYNPKSGEVLRRYVQIMKEGK
jgi:hypothetical protein